MAAAHHVRRLRGVDTQGTQRTSVDPWFPPLGNSIPRAANLRQRRTDVVTESTSTLRWERGLEVCATIRTATRLHLTARADDESLALVIMLKPAAARGKRLPETMVAKICRVTRHATNAAVLNRVRRTHRGAQRGKSCSQKMTEGPRLAQSSPNW